MFRSSSKLTVAFLSVVALFSCLASAWAEVYVKGYTRRDGTHVSGHYRSNPDGIFSNNWSTVGNQNPHTGKWGTLRNPPADYGGSRYGSGSRTKASHGSSVLANRVDNITLPSTSLDELTEPTVNKQFERFQAFSDRRKYEPKDIRPGMSDDERQQHTSLSDELDAAGVNLTWRLYTPDRLDLMKRRKEAAERLAKLGLNLPWQMRTLEELLALEQQLLAADAKGQREIIAANTGSEGLWWQRDLAETD